MNFHLPRKVNNLPEAARGGRKGRGAPSNNNNKCPRSLASNRRRLNQVLNGRNAAPPIRSNPSPSRPCCRRLEAPRERCCQLVHCYLLCLLLLPAIYFNFAELQTFVLSLPANADARLFPIRKAGSESRRRAVGKWRVGKGEGVAAGCWHKNSFNFFGRQTSNASA